jgi:hypothetical protein
MDAQTLTTLCPWCGSVEDDSRPHCTRCGGPLHVETGVKVPPAPRSIPATYVRQRLWFSVTSLVGMLFMGIAGLMMTSGAVLLLFAHERAGLYLILFPSLHFVLGAAIFHFGRRKARRQIMSLQHGVPVDAVVSASEPDRTQSFNGRNPWMLRYTFDVKGVPFEGSVSTYNISLARRYGVNARVKVVYLSTDPDANCLYPPM